MFSLYQQNHDKSTGALEYPIREQPCSYAVLPSCLHSSSVHLAIAEGSLFLEVPTVVFKEATQLTGLKIWSSKVQYTSPQEIEQLLEARS
jgi:hypothetical protein